MDMGLAGRVVLVTGGSSGIGRATAVAFAREGGRVAITYHSNRAGAEETAAMVGAAGTEAMIVPYDLSDEGSIRLAMEEIMATKMEKERNPPSPAPRRKPRARTPKAEKPIAAAKPG